MAIDTAILYAILREVAVSRRQPFHYSDLSVAYQQRTGDWHEPHGTWDEPLGVINTLAYNHVPKLPPLSAVVTTKPDSPHEQPEPGARFWGSSPGVPSKPRGVETLISVRLSHLRESLA